MTNELDRRELLKTLSTVGIAGTAGCYVQEDDTSGGGLLPGGGAGALSFGEWPVEIVEQLGDEDPDGMDSPTFVIAESGALTLYVDTDDLPMTTTTTTEDGDTTDLQIVENTANVETDDLPTVVIDLDGGIGGISYWE